MKKKNMFSRLLQVCQTEKSIIKKRTAGRKYRSFAESVKSRLDLDQNLKKTRPNPEPI